MGLGNSANQKVDWINNFDPRVLGLAAPKGTLFRYVPLAGAPKMLLKFDDGFSTNWQAPGEGDQEFVYVVTPGIEDYPTIQSAIDQAFADGSGGTQIATILVPPGTYVENLIFRPGQAIISQGTLTSIGAVRISGHHTYTPPVNTDPLSVQVCLQGLSFIDTGAGDTISVLGTEGSLFTLQGCSFIKNFSGHALNCINPNGIFVVTGCSTTTYAPTDSFIASAAFITVIQGCSHSSGSSSPMLDSTSLGFVTFSRNECTTGASYIASFTSGSIGAYQNYFQTYGTDADGIRVGAGATLLMTNSTLFVSAGTGYVFQGTGNVSATLIAYNGNTAKDPGLTFTLLPSET